MKKKSPEEKEIDKNFNALSKREQEEQLALYNDILEFAGKLIDKGYMILTLQKSAQMLETRLKTAVVSTKKWKQINDDNKEFVKESLNMLEKSV